MCARKMPAVVGLVRAIDVFLEEFESVDADCRKQLRLEVSSRCVHSFVCYNSPGTAVPI